MAFEKKSRVVKIQPIVEFVTRVEVVCVVFCLKSGFFCLLFRVWEKGERWSGAREMLAWRRWRKGKLSACAPRRRTYLSSGVTCAWAWAQLHLVPWLPSSFFFCLMPVPSLDVAHGEWRGTSACYARTVLPDTRHHPDQTFKKRALTKDEQYVYC